MDTASAARLFDANAPTYDRVNTLISAGLDARWRRWAAEQAVTREGARVLDAFAGTGLVGVEAAALGADVTLADASPRMLAAASAHAAERNVAVRAVLTDLSTPGLPFAPSSFDAVTVSFGVRYLDAPATVLARLATLLAPDGRLVVLEFVRPDGGLISRAAAVYFFRVLPRIAARLAGHGELYACLTDTVRLIGHARDLEDVVKNAGLEVLDRRRMGFGLVAGLVCVPRR